MNPSQKRENPFCAKANLAVCFAAVLVSALTTHAADTVVPKANPDVSLRNEVEHAINKGLGWLEKNQDTNGFWSTADHPAITGLALSAFMLQPGARDQKSEPLAVRQGYAFLLKCAQPDGGIYRKELPSYNTSLSLMALSLSRRPEFEPIILKARKFIVGLQAGPDEVDKNGNSLAGGIGYGVKDKTADLSNTSLALEAMAASKSRLGEQKDAVPDLNWAAAIRFIQSCQNLPSHNPAKWASDDPQNKGGFIYAPGASKAGETNLPSGRIALRSYGSMSYAGLLSYIYADLKRDDSRVNAVMDWLKGNFTLEENPGMGQQGLYYYFHTMAKALTLYGSDLLPTAGGKNVKWREQLALKLINLQQADGSWANENGRWFEKDPVLVTAYSLMALELMRSRI